MNDLTREQALEILIRFLCESTPAQIEHFCEQFGWSEEDLDEACKLLEKEAGLRGMGIL